MVTIISQLHSFNLKLLPMTSNTLEKVQVYLVSHAVTRYCMIYFGKSSKIGIYLQNKSCMKISDVENLKNLFLIH